MLRDVNLALDFFPGRDLEVVWSNLHISRDYSVKILDRKILLFLFLAFLLRAIKFKYCAFLEATLVQTTLFSGIKVI